MLFVAFDVCRIMRFVAYYVSHYSSVCMFVAYDLCRHMMFVVYDVCCIIMFVT